MLKSTLAAVVALGFVGGVAFAGETVVAKLATPKAEAGRVIADGAVWTCAGDSCTATLTRKANARACSQLAQEVGQIVQFGALDETELARCNQRAAATTTTAVANR
jgi:hypothetical protein